MTRLVIRHFKFYSWRREEPSSCTFGSWNGRKINAFRESGFTSGMSIFWWQTFPVFSMKSFEFTFSRYGLIKFKSLMTPRAIRLRLTPNFGACFGVTCSSARFFILFIYLFNYLFKKVLFSYTYLVITVYLIFNIYN